VKKTKTTRKNKNKKKTDISREEFTKSKNRGKSPSRKIKKNKTNK
jgi:hypothetical protein